MTLKTFSSILPFTRRFGVRGVTCMTSGAQGGGGGTLSPSNLGDSILTSICNQLVDMNLSVGINDIYDADAVGGVLDEMVEKHGEAKVSGALKVLESEGRVQLQRSIGEPDPPLEKITAQGFQRYVETHQAGHPDFPFAGKVGKSILALNEPTLTVEDVRSKCSGIPPLLIEYGLVRLEQTGAIRILDGVISPDGGGRVISCDRAVLMDKCK